MLLDFEALDITVVLLKQHLNGSIRTERALYRFFNIALSGTIVLYTALRTQKVKTALSNPSRVNEIDMTDEHIYYVTPQHQEGMYKCKRHATSIDSA